MHYGYPITVITIQGPLTLSFDCSLHQNFPLGEI